MMCTYLQPTKPLAPKALLQRPKPKHQTSYENVLDTIDQCKYKV